MEAFLLLGMGVINIACFVIGAKVGQAVTRGEKVTVAPDNPLNAIREREDKRKAKEEQERIDTIMRNIENYDGTPHGQEDVPLRGV